MFSYQKILNQVPEDYYDSGVRTNPFQWLWHSWKFHNLKKVLVGMKGNILDIGCADGSLTEKIKEYLEEANLVGIDKYKKTINYAIKKWKGVKFIAADARKLPFANNKFDNILCIETLEHIPQNHLAIAEFRRVLKRNGKLVVCQDTDSWLFNFIWFFWTKWKGSVWNGAHVNCMKPENIKNLLVSNGFKIISKKFTHFGLEVIFVAKKI